MDGNFLFFTEWIFVDVWTIDKQFVCIDSAGEKETGRYKKKKRNDYMFFNVPHF